MQKTETEKPVVVFESIAEFNASPYGKAKDPSGYLEWERNEKPHLWVRLQNAGNVRLESDVAWGRLRIVRDGEVLGDSKQEPVVSQDGAWIGIADYFGYPEGRLYRQVAPQKD